MRRRRPPVKDNRAVSAAIQTAEGPLFQTLSGQRAPVAAGPALPCVKTLARLGFRTILKPRTRTVSALRTVTPSMMAIGNLINTVIWLYTLVLIVQWC